MILRHDIGTSIELRDSHRDAPLWRYVYGGKPKPFFHPLCTPAGHVLTNFEPHDHFWHRGLWFTIKFINGENFWEENLDGFGRQKTRLPPTITHAAGGQISLFSSLDWVRPDEKTTVIHEQRLINYRPIDSSSYAIDFTFILLPTVDLLLDRTPYTTWGGYGGLTFRGNRNWQESRLLFADGTTSDRPTPKISQWCDLSGKFDGGINQAGGIAIFDHPRNPRYPTPWYGGTGTGHYFNAAFLFNEPMKVPAKEKLRFQYRTFVHDGIPDVAKLESAYKQYLGEAAESGG